MSGNLNNCPVRSSVTHYANVSLTSDATLVARWDSDSLPMIAVKNAVVGCVR